MTNPKSTTWCKSSYSSGASSMCVEVYVRTDRALVRDSKCAMGPILGFDSRAWRMFVGDVGGDLMRRRGVASPSA